MYVYIRCDVNQKEVKSVIFTSSLYNEFMKWIIEDL